MPINNYGSYAARRMLTRNGDIERTLDEAWLKACREDSHFLKQVLLKHQEPGDLVDSGIAQMEVRAAASAIRWLGTNVGFCWLRQTLEKEGIMVYERRDKTPDDFKERISKQATWPLDEYDLLLLIDRKEFPNRTEIEAYLAKQHLPLNFLARLMRQGLVERIKGYDKDQYFHLTAAGQHVSRHYYIRNPDCNLASTQPVHSAIDL